MKKYINQFGFTLITLIALASCVNLKHVNDFSSSSLQSITSFRELNYSFTQNCIDKCVRNDINTLKINPEECQCKLNKVADSITLKIYNSINSYFDGLVKLSNNQLTAYKTEDLETALTEGDFGPIKIKKAQVTSYSKISQLLIRAYTGTYRKRKLKEYVRGANSPVRELLKFLEFTISNNLNGKLNVKKERIKADYFDLIKDNSLSIVEKRNAVSNYYSEIDAIDSQQKKLKTYSKSLKKISEGHQKLYENIDKLSAKESKQILYLYANEIKI
jgi:hypothetical protein